MPRWGEACAGRVDEDGDVDTGTASTPCRRPRRGIVGTTTVDDAYRGLAAEKPGHEVDGAGF